MCVFVGISEKENVYSMSYVCHHPFVWFVGASRWLQYSEPLGRQAGFSSASCDFPGCGLLYSSLHKIHHIEDKIVPQ